MAAKWETAELTSALRISAPATRPAISISSASARDPCAEAEAGEGGPDRPAGPPAEHAEPEHLGGHRAEIGACVGVHEVEALGEARAVDDLPAAAPPSMATMKIRRSWGGHR